ncbi:MAG: hypothetical protein GEU95_00850 [Rhizobiales bacterium]|nr:hypothetical protein [Hyphomicrobiales bacterium]
MAEPRIPDPTPEPYGDGMLLCVSCAMMAALMVAIVTLLLWATTAPAQARDFDSANHALQACTDYINPDANRNMFAQGDCAGVVRTIFYFGRTHFNACPPRGVTIWQATRVIVAYIRARPSRLHEDFRNLAVEALRAAWPCRNTTGNPA